MLALAAIATVAVGAPLAARALPPADRYRLGVGLALALVLYRSGYVPVAAWLRDERWLDMLPLHICGLLFYVGAYALWKRRQLAYEVTYFWGMGGALQAVLTPDLAVPFPHPEAVMFFFGHGLLFLTIGYTTFALGLRPEPRSIPRVLGITAAYAVLLYPVNRLLGTNFMYLVRKPEGASLLDHLGDWPWYIVVGLGVAGASYVVWYLPFALADRARRAGNRAAGP